MTSKPLTQHGGASFTCDECALSRYVQGHHAPSGWTLLIGFTDTPNQVFHACSLECSNKLKTKHKRI